MPHPDERAALGILTVKRLGGLCDTFELERSDSARKDDLIELLAAPEPELAGPPADEGSATPGEAKQPRAAAASHVPPPPTAGSSASSGASPTTACATFTSVASTAT